MVLSSLGGSGGGQNATWRHFPLELGAPADLLEAGVALLDSVAPDAPGILRWYRATEPALVLGRGQPGVITDVPGLPVLTRFSGGGGVLMNEFLLCLDVILPGNHPWLDGPMTDAFGRVGQAWAQALRALDVDDVVVYDRPGTASRRGTPREQLLAAICYATLGYGEVTVAGRKLVGLAQRRRRSGALVQCGLLRRWEPGPLLAAFAGADEDAEITAAAVGLDELVHPAPDDAALMAAVTTALQEAIETS